MNLLDRMQKDEPKEKKKNDSLPRNETSKDTTQKLNQQSMDLIQKQSAALKKVTAERDSLLKNGRPEDQELIQKLSSEKQSLASTVQKQTSMIADLRTEISDITKTNQSLTKNNRYLVMQNDELRNNSGLKLRKEQQKLEEDIEAVQASNIKLRAMVNKSSVDAVDRANARARAAEADRDNKVKAAENKAWHKMYEADEKCRKAIEKAKNDSKRSAEQQTVAYGLLLFTLICNAIMSRSFLGDIGEFFVVLFSGLAELWDEAFPAMASGTFYNERFPTAGRVVSGILVFGLIILCFVFVGWFLLYLIRKYKERWCRLSLIFTCGSLAVCIVFGPIINHINLLLLFLLLQVGYLVALWYFDGYYETRGRTYEWKRIQGIPED
jgi:hypothetical protein